MLKSPSVAQFDRQLWSGFGAYAVKELEALKSTEVGAKDWGAAAWVLARWFAYIGDYASALSELNDAKRFAEHEDWGLEQRLLEIFTLAKLGRAEDVESAFGDALSSLGELPEICLLGASVVGLGKSARIGQSEIDRRRLAWINKPFIAARLAPILIGDAERQLAFDNLTTAPVAKHSQAATAKLSVIMPAYNAAKTLPTALRSVLAQSWDNLEVLVVDDASTDETWSMIQAFAADDTRVKPFRHDFNRGAYGARNTGLCHASGDFVTVHDSDDWSHPQKFAMQVADLLNSGKPFNTTMSARISPEVAVRFKMINLSLLYDNMTSLMLKRADIVALGGWDEPRMQADEELYYRLLALHELDRNVICPGVPLTLMLARQELADRRVGHRNRHHQIWGPPSI